VVVDVVGNQSESSGKWLVLPLWKLEGGSREVGSSCFPKLLLFGSASSSTADVLVVVGKLEVVDRSCLQFQATEDPC
jgi:hypothetical protein